MPWAAHNTISTSPIEGGIEITDADYQAALEGIMEGKIVSIEGGEFALVDPSAPEPEPEPKPEPPTKQTLAEYAAAKRYEKEVGGTEWNGWPVHTDRESQSKIIAELLAIEAGERDDPDGWKFADGVFRMVSNADFVDLASAVRQHVRDCFALEAAILAQIEAGTITEYSQIDAALSLTP